MCANSFLQGRWHQLKAGEKAIPDFGCDKAYGSAQGQTSCISFSFLHLDSAAVKTSALNSFVCPDGLIINHIPIARHPYSGVIIIDFP